MSSSDWIAICAIVVTILLAIIAGLFKRIGTLEAKLDAKDLIIDNKDDTIAELKRQNDRLEITGTLMNRFFSQLPTSNEIKREIQP